MLMSVLLPVAILATGAAPLGPFPATPRRAGPDISVAVDSSKHEVIITAGPFDLPDMPPMEDHAMMDHGASHDTPVQHFVWPVEGWFRGFRLEVVDRDGTVLPRRIMHHLIMVNFDRRQLLYQAAERLMGAGTETEDASIPKTIGVPLEAGTDLGIYVAWHNDVGRDLEGVTLRVVMEYLPTNQNPRPLSVMPLYMDVNLHVGGTNTFDVPPGRSEKAYEFTMPISGRLLGVGGHLHDYGVGVRLEDAETGKELIDVTSTRDDKGRVAKVSRSLPGVRGRGVKLEAGHTYRVVGVYDNPKDETIVNGAMAHIVGIFAPDDPNAWPEIDPRDPTFQKDLASLEERGGGEEEQEHGEHDHGSTGQKADSAAQSHSGH